ncbi:GNAT family N-acetyltransferase [Streptomyces sp. ME19-03-3]|nr:GNAT family N-acetyltransferase [Streptomyces sp. ME19-03-3]
MTVGTATVHGRTNMVEIGHSAAPGHRRQGYTRTMLTALLRRAAAEPGVRTARVTISPENTASPATICGCAFVEVGEQWDEVDGLERILELSV